MASPVLRMSMSGALCVRKRPIVLTRRSGIPPCGIAGCAPAQRCVRPVLAPAQAFVRAGERRGKCGIRTRRGRLIRAVWMFCARRVCFYGSVGAVALGVRQSLRFCSGRLRSMCVSPCGFVRGICARCASVPAVLPGQWFALGARPALRLCRGVWPRFTPVFFPLSGKKRRLAGCCVPIPPWVEIAGSAFSWCRCGYLTWRVHFGFVRFFMAISTGYRDAGTELRGGRGWRRGACALLRRRIGLDMLSAGSTLGLRAPNLRQRVFDSLDSLHAAAGLC